MRRKKNKKKRKPARNAGELWTDPYLEAWLKLTPAQRLARSWRLRRRLRDLQAIHDAKSLPQL
ncbi:MAG: hypothetical protein AB1486_00745 [Planctomycetota bacterium]